jgi:hypothetical protein
MILSFRTSTIRASGLFWKVCSDGIAGCRTLCALLFSNGCGFNTRVNFSEFKNS